MWKYFPLIFPSVEFSFKTCENIVLSFSRLKKFLLKSVKIFSFKSLRIFSRLRIFSLKKCEDISKSRAAQLGGERSQHFEKAEKRTSVTHFKSFLPLSNYKPLQTNPNQSGYKIWRKKTGKRTSVKHFKSSLPPTANSPRQIRTNLDTKYEFLNSQFSRYLKG